MGKNMIRSVSLLVMVVIGIFGFISVSVKPAQAKTHSKTAKLIRVQYQVERARAILDQFQQEYADNPAILGVGIDSNKRILVVYVLKSASKKDVKKIPKFFREFKVTRVFTAKPVAQH